MRALRQVAAKLQVCYPSLCTRSAGIDALQVMVLELGLVLLACTLQPPLWPVYYCNTRAGLLASVLFAASLRDWS